MGQRYARQEALFGLEGQDRIAESAAGIIGLGGLGSHVAQQLAYLGVVNFVLVDHDDVSATNLNRLIGAVPEDVTRRRSKVEVARRMITAVQPEARISAVDEQVTSAAATHALEDATVTFSCVDSDAVRLRIIELCAGRVPWFDLATDTHADADGMRFGGRVLFSGDAERCPFCMDLLDQDAIRRAGMSRGELEEESRTYGVSGRALQETGPSVVSLNGVVASLAVMEFVKGVTGMVVPRPLTTYIGEQGVVRFSLDAPAPQCPYCKAGSRSTTRLLRAGELSLVDLDWRRRVRHDPVLAFAPLHYLGRSASSLEYFSRIFPPGGMRGCSNMHSTGPDAADLAFAALLPLADATASALERVDRAVRDERRQMDPLRNGFTPTLQAATVGLGRFGYAVREVGAAWVSFRNVQSVSTAEQEANNVHLWTLDDQYVLRIKRDPVEGVAEGTQRLFSQLPADDRPSTVFLTWGISLGGQISTPRFVCIDEPKWTISVGQLLAHSSPPPAHGPSPTMRGPVVRSKVNQSDELHEDG